MVRSVKDLLRRTNGRARLFYDELEVNLIEIESVINARPLSYIGEGADDSLPITPNQFLNNRRSTSSAGKFRSFENVLRELSRTEAHEASPE